MRHPCFDAIDGFEELIKTGDVKICFLRREEYTDRPKAPMGLSETQKDQICLNYLHQNGVDSFEELGEDRDLFLKKINGKYYNHTVEDANANPHLNIGFTLPRKEELKEEFWVAFDVDGQDKGYMIKDSPEMKKATRLYIAECIKKGLEKRGIKYVLVKTINDGYHFYFKTTKSDFIDHPIGKKMKYPSSLKLIQDVNPEKLKDLSILQGIVDQEVEKGVVEVFTAGKMVVAPGSVIEGKTYELQPDGVQDYRDVSVYRDDSVEELLLTILEEDCFFYRKPEEQKEEYTHHDFKAQNQDTQALTETNVKNIGDFMIKAFQEISGQKHYATLALGGFLHNKNVSEEDITRIGEYIINNAPDDLFSGSKETERTSGFLPTLIHDSKEDEEKERTGLTTLKDMFKGTSISVADLTKVLWINSSPQFHTFAPNGENLATYEKVTIDFLNKETKLINYKAPAPDDEEGSPKRLSGQIIKHVVTDINYIDDISSSPVSGEENMPISFKIKSRLKPDRLIIKNTTKDFIENYDSLPLAHSPGSKNILSLVIDEYESIGLMGVTERSTLPGIYISRDGKQLRRFIQKHGEIVECFPELPDKEKLKDALKLLKKINDAYPWYDDKFATFVKLGMIIPYGYVFKTQYGSFIRGIILYGEGGTCKSSASELLINMNIPHESIDEEELEYILPGSEFSTPYRMGKALSNHSYPIMIEEVENVFETKENRDLIKNSITRKFIRNPNSEKKYYSRAVPIFSANELSDEIEKSGMFRRFLILNFVNGERGDTPEIEEGLSFLNKDGIRNSRFRELYIISEYIFYTMANNLDLFSYSPQEIIDTVLKEMQTYTQMDLSWLIEPQFDSYYQTDRSYEDQTDLTMVLDTLKYHFKNSIKLSGIGSNVNEQFLDNLIEDKYSYLFRVKNKKTNGVLITADFNKVYKKNYPEAKKLSLDRLEELLNEGLTLKKPIIKKRITPSGFKRRMIGLLIDWEDFCNIFNVRTTKEEDE